MTYKTLAIPRFPDMTLRDAIELGTRRLEEDGFVEVRFDPTSEVDDSVPTHEGDRELVFQVVAPTLDVVTG